MSVCTFIASDHPLPAAAPKKDYPLDIKLDSGTVFDGDADDNFFLHLFDGAGSFTNKKYGVCLEWRCTQGRAKELLKYIKAALENTESVEIWHVWLGDCYEYEDSPVVHSRTISIKEMTADDIIRVDEAEIWNKPDKMYPNRPSFYRWTITN